MKIVYVVQSFSRQVSGGKSTLITDTAIPCSTEHEAVIRAERLADKRAGVIAVSQEYDEDSGEYGNLIVLRKYGEIPVGAIVED